MGKSKNNWTKELFVQLPHFILKSIAYKSLGAWDRTLLIELILQYNGSNNGDLSAPYSFMKTRGFNSSGTLSNASKELEKKGLIEITKFPRRTGTNFEMTKLVALTWLPIDGCKDKHGNYKLEVSANPTPSHKWKKHEPMTDIEQSKKIVEKRRKDQWLKDWISIQKDYGN